MACGTGKTFTSLKITEKLVPEGGLVLFLVPSISLLSQTVKEWTIEASVPLRSYAVCSDVKVGERKVSEDISVHDLAFPATTNARSLVTHVNANFAAKPLTVIFSTYQSIQVLSDAQKMGLPEFDLIICDEAHRTTGVTLADAEESAFVRVHDNDFIRAKKRLYMTATPRIYSDASKVQAEEGGAIRALQKAYRITEPDAGRIVASADIRHVYGSLGALPWHHDSKDGRLGFGNLDADLRMAASGIRTYSERSDDIERMRQLRDLVQASRVIVFLGFGYLDTNLQIVEPHQENDPDLIIGSTYGLSEFNVTKVREHLRGWYSNKLLGVEGVMLPQGSTAKSLLDDYGRALV